MARSLPLLETWAEETESGDAAELTGFLPKIRKYEAQVAWLLPVRRAKVAGAAM